MGIEEDFTRILMQKKATKIHVLKSGENVGILARKYNVTEQQIWDENPTSNLEERASSLQIGEKIFIPESALNAGKSLVGKTLNEQIDLAAAWAKVDKDLLRAMVNIESGGKANAISGKGAQGLGQLMPSIQKAFGITDPYDSSQNLPATAMWLAGLMKTSPGKTKEEKSWHALMQYNWSPAKFFAWVAGGKIAGNVPAETKKHTKKVFTKLGWSIPTEYLGWYV